MNNNPPARAASLRLWSSYINRLRRRAVRAGAPLAAIALLALARPAQGQTLGPVCSHPSDYPAVNPGGYARHSLFDTTNAGGTLYATAYDAFILDQTVTIQEITWRGGYFNPAPAQGSCTGFTVNFYAAANDVAAEPILTPVLNQTVAAGNAGETVVTGNFAILLCDYHLTLAAPFTAQAGVKYWISIVADMAGISPEWGWASGTGGDGISLNFSHDFPHLLVLNDLAFALLSDNFAPVINTHPASQTVNAGSNVTFTVSAEGRPLPAYQWRKGVADINGATGSSYAINNVQLGDAGSYTVAVTNLHGSKTSNAAGLTVNQGAATVSLSNLNQTYNGAPKAVTVTTNPPGLAVTVTYNGGATAPTAPGSYAVSAAINDANYAGSTTGTLVIAKAAATVTLSNLAQTYNGAAKTATATTIPPGLTVSITYNGGATAPTNPGTYAVSAAINDANYAGSTTGTLVIAKAAATVALSNLAQTYDGTGKTCAATTTPPGLAVNYTYNGSATAPVNAGDYAVVATINDAIYTGSATGTLTIAKALVTIYLTNLYQTYTGTPLSASAYTVPNGYAVSFTYDGGATAPTNAGDYAVVAAVNQANYQGTAAGTLTIAKAAATVALSNLSQTYDGAAKLATVTTTPPGLSVNITYDGSPNAPVNAGSYAVAAAVSDANYQGGGSGTLEVAKAAQALTFAALPGKTYGDTSFDLAAAATSGLPVSYASSAPAVASTSGATVTIHAAGLTVITATQPGDGNYNAAPPVQRDLTVGKAAATVALTGLQHTYNGAAKTATATTTPPGLTVIITYNGGAAAPVNAGNYNVAATINDASYQGSAADVLLISKATATVTLSNLEQTYDGAAKTVAVATNPPGLAVNVTYDGSSAAPDAVGSYAVAAAVSDANYEGSAAGALVISQGGNGSIFPGAPGFKWGYIGWLEDSAYPWVYQFEHGWWYCVPVADKAVWFYDLQAGWLYVDNASYNGGDPARNWIYEANGGCWLWYYKDAAAPAARWFSSSCTGGLVSIPKSL